MVGHSTKQGLDLWTRGLVDLWTRGLVDLWTCGLVDSFFLYFTKMQKRSIAALDMILLLICTMSHCRALPERKI